jgi:apoptosis-resistant E3 ubiquitin protein ligase 1
LFDPRGGLFCTFHDKRQALVHPNPTRPTNLKLKYYEFAGKIVGKCLYESALGGTYRQMVRARFTRSFLAQLIGLRVHYKYFEQDDPDLYLSKIKYILDTDLDNTESLELFFVEEVYDTHGQLAKTIELIPNGSKVRVTNATKNQVSFVFSCLLSNCFNYCFFQYLDALAQQRLCNNVRDEIDSFLKGLNGIIPDNLLSIFDENELELLLCGTGEYSIADFRANHIVNGGSTEFRRVLGWFWAAVGNFSRTEMARLLQFTTGCSQLPPSGFQDLNPRFQLTAAPTFGNLPTAHTWWEQSLG